VFGLTTNRRLAEDRAQTVDVALRVARETASVYTAAFERQIDRLTAVYEHAMREIIATSRAAIAAATVKHDAIAARAVAVQMAAERDSAVVAGQVAHEIASDPDYHDPLESIPEDQLVGADPPLSADSC